MDELLKKAHQYFIDSQNTDDNWTKSLELIEQALELAPGMALYWIAKASYLYELEDYDNALKTIDHEIELNLKPTSYLAWAYKGMILERIGEYRQAAEAYIKSLNAKPTFANYTLLAFAQFEFDPKAAKESAIKALELNPDWDEAKDILAQAEKKIEEEKQNK